MTIATRISVLSLTIILVGLGLFAPVLTLAFGATASNPTFNNVQIFVTPQNSSLNQFSMTVYNSTGGVIATSQSSYPAFSFELPTGNYLFAAIASSTSGYGVYPPVAYSGAAGAPSSSGSAAILPKGYYGYQQEYGYLQSQVNSAKTLNISTSELSSITTSQITIQAKYVNGTAAQGATVYASPLGAGYWYYPGSTLMMYNQTGNDGMATLTVPNVPLDVTVWSWLPVNLPQSQVTTQVTVAGEPVNVTVYWQPTYLGLAGSALLIPPFQQQTSITLRAQQQNYWAYPQGVASSASSVAVPGVQGAGSQGTIANTPSAIPAGVAAQEQGKAASSGTPQSQVSPPSVVTVTATQPAVTTTVPQSSSSSNGLVLEAGILVAVIISIAAAILALRKK